jgi:UDP-perosamine 4-acetyltransferase
MNKEIVFIGAGGHAKVVYEAAESSGIKCFGFVDGKVQNFYGLKKISEDELTDKMELILSFGAVTVESLVRRKQVFLNYKDKGFKFVNVINPTSYISETAEIGSGVFIGVSSTLNPDCKVGSNSIINTGVIIEHDVTIGHSSHICPGAIVLGGAKVGENCLIGAGAVVLPNAIVPDSTLVPANTRF